MAVQRIIVVVNYMYVGCSQLYPQDQSRMEVSYMYIVCVKVSLQYDAGAGVASRESG